MRRRYGTFNVTRRGFAMVLRASAELLLLKSTLVSFTSLGLLFLLPPSSSFYVDDANRGTCGTSQMKLTPGLYDVHTAFALANNVHFIGFALNYRLAPPPPPPPTPMLPLRMLPTLAGYPINRAQKPSVNGHAPNSSLDLRRPRLLFRPSRLMLTQQPCSTCYRRLRRRMT
jgi:hypothetical protein